MKPLPFASPCRVLFFHLVTAQKGLQSVERGVCVCVFIAVLLPVTAQQTAHAGNDVPNKQNKTKQNKTKQTTPQQPTTSKKKIGGGEEMCWQTTSLCSVQRKQQGVQGKKKQSTVCRAGGKHVRESMGKIGIGVMVSNMRCLVLFPKVGAANSRVL